MAQAQPTEQKGKETQEKRVENLFKPLQLRSLTLNNRIGVSPMCQYSCIDGYPNDWHVVNLGSRCFGTGIVFVEATAVEDIGRITPRDLGIYLDEHVEGHKRIVDFVHTHSTAKIGIQLAHAGRKASHASPWGVGEPNKPLTVGQDEEAWQTVSSSNLPFDENKGAPPRSLTVEEIQKLVNETYPKAIQRAIKAGYDMIELHYAHGYLVHQFYSPLVNKRTDQYGGSFENRIRLPLEIATVARKLWPADRPISVRLSCDDWFDGGWSVDDTVQLAKELKKIGIDAIDCSGGYVKAGAPTRMPKPGPGFQVPYAERVRKEAEIPSFTVGGITQFDQAEEIIGQGRADVVLLAREMLRRPYWALEAAKHFGQWEEWSSQSGYAVSPATHRGAAARPTVFPAKSLRTHL